MLFLIRMLRKMFAEYVCEVLLKTNTHDCTVKEIGSYPGFPADFFLAHLSYAQDELL